MDTGIVALGINVQFGVIAKLFCQPKATIPLPTHRPISSVSPVVGRATLKQDCGLMVIQLLQLKHHRSFIASRASVAAAG